MSNDLNQCQFIGRLGKDPETRQMPNGDPVASFSIAVGSQWKGKNGDKQESTEWVNVSVFGALAKICGDYLIKGSQVFISGRMKTEKYTDKQGIEKYTTKIIADKMQMLGGKKDSDTSNQNTRQETKSSTASPDDLDLDYDIPF